MSEVRTFFFDAGNTRLKLWLCDGGGRLLAEASVSHDGCFERALAALPGDFNEQPEALLGASVLGDAQDEEFAAACEKKWSLRPRFALSQKEQLGISNAYGDDYYRLGVDRWLALLGCDAGTLAPGQKICVVDCGTAVTLDVLSANGMHEGGYIIPGLAMMRQALRQHTAKVRHEPLQNESIMPGKNTAEAVEHGTLMAVVSLVEYLAASPGMAVVLTGGDASRIGRQLRCSYCEEPRLLLKGLQRYFSDAGIS